MLVAVHDLARWLMDVAHDDSDDTAFMRALVTRLAEAGIPIWRASYALVTKHPEVLWRTVRWRAGMTSTEDQPRARLDDAFYRDSPVREVREGPTSIHVPLRDGIMPYPICADLRDAGGTGYLILQLPFATGEVGFISFATVTEGGFTPAARGLLEQLRPFLARRIELASSYYATRALLAVYLGNNAARRVLGGNFERGKGELIDAAIWFSDMRGFTQLSDRTSPERVVAMLDGYFDAAASAIAANGGEVLKFIGDAVMAVFPIGDDARDACRRARAAAETALAAITVEVGIGLHRGQVMYGNIGARDRLDFTVISAAVNEAARLEGLCKQLATPLALSAAFAEALGADDLLDLGSHALKGVSAPLHVFSPRGLVAS